MLKMKINNYIFIIVVILLLSSCYKKQSIYQSKSEEFLSKIEKNEFEDAYNQLTNSYMKNESWKNINFSDFGKLRQCLIKNGIPQKPDSIILRNDPAFIGTTIYKINSTNDNFYVLRINFIVNYLIVPEISTYTLDYINTNQPKDSLIKVPPVESLNF